MPLPTAFVASRAAACLAASLAGAWVLCSTPAPACAGPLNPPAGAIASTAKPLAEIEPRTAVNASNTPGDADSVYRITQPGSYYLTGNITGVAGRHGIQISSSGVTLDLNGFELRGVAGSLDGVNIGASDGVNIVVRRGSIRNWGDNGLECEYNAGHPPTCNLFDLTFSGNANMGVQVWSGSRLVDCTANENTGGGFSDVGDCSYTGCGAAFNGGDGFNTNSACTLNKCTAEANTGTGINTGLGCTVNACVTSGNATGFSLGLGTIATACSAYSASGNGFSTSSGAALTGCIASRNGASGFVLASGSSITNCTARENTGDGIRVSSRCLVLNCTASTNGLSAGDGAGIHATSSHNRIEGNHCTSADRGIDVDSADNFIARNTCGSNTLNWDVAAGNSCLVVLMTPAAGAISGDSGGASPGSTNPQANFTY
ncbi:MAG TPA: right-handed parallel beta-helix repeat-containing protein [Phycisphaerales bacterium]|nr:right-handed parallel beta-helix repeat-containing protein [Phycisphaerales bacterium]